MELGVVAAGESFAAADRGGTGGTGGAEPIERQFDGPGNSPFGRSCALVAVCRLLAMTGTSADPMAAGTRTATTMAADSGSAQWVAASSEPALRAPLGVQLRDVREAAGIGLRRLALKLNTSHATLSRWESGARRPGPREVAAYLDQVGADEGLRDELVALAARPEVQPAGQQRSSPRGSDGVAELLAVERESTRITSVSPLLVPDLLQTADYARAVLVASGVAQSEVDFNVAVRLGRGEVVAAKRIPIRVFLGEHVLRQRIGGPEVMIGQVRALRDACRNPVVDLRIVPDRVDWHPGLDGPFWIGERDGLPSVVCLEGRASALFLREPDQIASYGRAVQQVAEVSLGPEDSARRVDVASTELQREGPG